MKENIDRENVQYILHIETTDIIFTQHIKNQMLSNIILLSTQITLIIISIISGFIFEPEVSKVISCTISMTSILIMIGVIISCYIHTKTWNIAKQRYKDLERIIEPCFHKNYTVDDDEVIIKKLQDYKQKYKNI
jgi:flagellar motor component MotA